MFTKLDYVYAVYREKSFTRAAEKLFISQPSLSAAIKGVEKAVGVPLFDRSGTTITLTEVGREYIAAAEKIMRIREDFINKINDIYDLEVGKITVGGTNYLSSYVLPKIINEFSSRHPNIEVVLAEANSQTLHEMMKNEEIDIILDSFDHLPEEYQGQPLVHEHILLCVPADRSINGALGVHAIHPEDIYNNAVDLSTVPAVSIGQFGAESFVLLKNGNDMYHRAIRIFDAAGITPKVCFNVDQMNISYALADSGMGLCFATDTLFRFGKFGNNIVLYNVKEQTSGRTLYIAHKKSRYCTKAMSEFVRIAKEVATAERAAR